MIGHMMFWDYALNSAQDRPAPGNDNQPLSPQASFACATANCRKMADAEFPRARNKPAQIIAFAIKGKA